VFTEKPGPGGATGWPLIERSTRQVFGAATPTSSESHTR
jgi:hypothetical protein